MKLCIEGPPVTKKNSMKIIMVRGKTAAGLEEACKSTCAGSGQTAGRSGGVCS